MDSYELAQDIISTYAMHVQAGNAQSFTPEFKSLVDAALEYRTARELADHYRKWMAYPR